MSKSLTSSEVDEDVDDDDDVVIVVVVGVVVVVDDVIVEEVPHEQLELPRLRSIHTAACESSNVLTIQNARSLLLTPMTEKLWVDARCDARPVTFFF